MVTTELLPRSIIAEAKQLRILDQRRLPLETAYLDCTTTDSVIEAIKTLAVRGAPAIGLAAAYGLLLGRSVARDPDHALSQFEAAASALIAARPTALGRRSGLFSLHQINFGSLFFCLFVCLSVCLFVCLSVSTNEN